MVHQSPRIVASAGSACFQPPRYAGGVATAGRAYFGPTRQLVSARQSAIPASAAFLQEGKERTCIRQPPKAQDHGQPTHRVAATASDRETDKQPALCKALIFD